MNAELRAMRRWLRKQSFANVELAESADECARYAEAMMRNQKQSGALAYFAPLAEVAFARFEKLHAAQAVS